jgi:hypothetical protein
MPQFGQRSLNRLQHVDKRLREVLDEAILHIDFTIVCGHRNKLAQDEAYATGASKKQWPNSKHNYLPSKAVDFAPWNDGIDWEDHLAFARVYGHIEAVAAARGYQLRWGGDWDKDGSSTDQSFMDIGHLELID